MAVRYIVHNVEEAVNFYTKCLGFAIQKNWGPVVILTKENLELWISGPTSSAGRTLLNHQKPLAGGSNRLVVTVMDIQQTIEDLKKAGTTVISDVIKSPAGKWVVAADPSGNPVELFETRHID